MKIAVFDTYVKTREGARLHFDVLVPENKAQHAKAYAKQWLSEIGLPDNAIELESCRFCHNDMPVPEIAQQIHDKGYFILQMEGCPNPV